MKSKLFFLLLIFTGSYAISQEEPKCKYVINKVDDFTKERKAMTDTYLLFNAKEVSADLKILNLKTTVQAYNKNGQNHIKIIVDMSNSASSNLFTHVYLLLQNDSTIKLEGTSTWIEEVKDVMFNVYEMSDEEWILLKNNPVKKVRIVFMYAATLDFEVKEKNSKNVSYAINCIDALNIPKAKK